MMDLHLKSVKLEVILFEEENVFKIKINRQFTVTHLMNTYIQRKSNNNNNNNNNKVCI